jgi:hypothetical protein
VFTEQGVLHDQWALADTQALGAATPGAVSLGLRLLGLNVALSSFPALHALDQGGVLGVVWVQQQASRVATVTCVCA